MAQPDEGRALGNSEKRGFAWMQISDEKLRFRAVNEDGEVIGGLRFKKNGKIESPDFR